LARHFLRVGLLAAVGWTSLAHAQELKTYALSTFENKSGVAVNDLHVKLIDKGKFEAASLSGDPYLSVRRFNEPLPLNSLDWTTADGSMFQAVAVNDKISFFHRGTDFVDPDPNKSYFTKDGAKKATKCVRAMVDVGAAPAPKTVRVSFTNDVYSETLQLTAVEVRVDNSDDPFAFDGNDDPDPFIPDGTIASGVPSSLSLTPGETKSYDVSVQDLMKAVSVTNSAAVESDSGNSFTQLTATIVGATALVVPTLSEWGVIVTCLLLVTWGIVILRSRRRKLM